MAATALGRFLGLFGDQVYSSTDLNRRGGEVLNHARKGPVTVRGTESSLQFYAVMLRLELIRATSQFGPTMELVEGALNVAEGKKAPTSLSWQRLSMLVIFAG